MPVLGVGAHKVPEEKKGERERERETEQKEGEERRERREGEEMMMTI